MGEYEPGSYHVLRKVYGQTLESLGHTYPDIVVLDAELAKSTQTAEFARSFPDRFFDLGIAEQDMMGTAAGLANYGKIVFASSFAIFATGRAWEQIRNSICYPSLPVRIVATHAGITVGPDGGSHQAVEDIAVMRCIPNMRVVVPADAVETEAVLEHIVKYNDGPVYVRLGRDKARTVHASDYRFTFGYAPVLREGADVALLACGIMTGEAVLAAEILAAEGIDAAVVNVSSIKPIDEKTILAMAKKTGALVTCEEHNMYGGLFSAVAEVCAMHHPVFIEPVAMYDSFGESGEPEELLEKYGLTAASIAAHARKVLERKQS